MGKTKQIEMGKSETNKNGVYGKYIIRRTDGTEIDPNDEYFVLKVKGSGDPKHIEACRQALLAYAKEIQSYLPDLAHDIDMRYGDYPVKNSHSPTISKTETVPDTLQEGDWFIGTEEQYRKVLEVNTDPILIPSVGSFSKQAYGSGFIVYMGKFSITWNTRDRLAQLTPEEFIRRAENTFKTC